MSRTITPKSILFNVFAFMIVFAIAAKLVLVVGGFLAVLIAIKVVSGK